MASDNDAVPEASEGDLDESQREVSATADRSPTGADPEAPEADALEQSQAVGPQGADADEPASDPEAPEADAMEQRQEVGEDDADEWR